MVFLNLDEIFSEIGCVAAVIVVTFSVAKQTKRISYLEKTEYQNPAPKRVY